MSVVVVCLASDWSLALHYNLCRFCLRSEAWPFTVGLLHLVPHLFQFQRCRCSRCRWCPNSTSVSDCVSISHESYSGKTAGWGLVISCNSARNAYQTFFHEGNNDTSPMVFELILRQGVWFPYLPGSTLRDFRDIDFAVLCELVYP